jgi:hypothetical protein
MGILQNGCKVNKSASPVMIASALPDKARERYILSLGSRQMVTLWITRILVVNSLNSSKNSRRVSILVYLLNFSFIIILDNSLTVSVDDNKIPAAFAFLKAKSGIELFRRAALIRTLLSITNFNYSFFKSSSKTSGVNPLFFACLLISSIISRMSLLLVKNRLNLLETDSFSEVERLRNLSAALSFTLIVIVFMTVLSI